MEKGVLYQLIILITSGNSSALARLFTAEVDIPRRRAASAPEYLPFFTTA